MNDKNDLDTKVIFETSIQSYSVNNQVNIDGNVINSLNINTYTTKQQLKKKSSIIFNVPNPVSSFCGRDTEIATIHDLFDKYKIVAVYGMAGIGKTELVKQYANLHLNEYNSNVIWINAEHKDSTEKSFYDLGKTLEITADKDVQFLAQDTYTYFSDIPVLFVFDNVLNRQSIKDLLPSKFLHSNSPIHILITTQNKFWDDDIPTMLVNPLTDQNAIAVFSALLGQRYRKEEEKDWSELAQILNCIPLALQISGALIREEIILAEEMNEEYAVKEYIDLLYNEENTLIDESFPDNSENDYSKTLHVAVKTSLKKIQSNEKDASIALDVLNIFSYLNSDEINRKTLQIFNPLNITKEKIRKAFAVLLKYSFIVIDNEMIRIHRLIQWILRYDQIKEQTAENYYRLTLEFIEMPDYYRHYRSILKHDEYFKDTIFQFALLKNKTKILTTLIRNGCNNSVKLFLNSKPIDQIILLIQSHNWLHEAVYHRQIKMLIIFLSYKADINVKGRWYGRTILHEASWRTLPDFVELIIKTGAELDVQDNNGRTALHLAAGLGRWRGTRNENPAIETLKLLTEAGAKVNMVDDNGWNLLHASASSCSKVITEWLLKNCNFDVNVLDKNGQSPIFKIFARKIRNEFDLRRAKDTFELLVYYGAKTDLVDNEGLNIGALEILNDNLLLI